MMVTAVVMFVVTVAAIIWDEYKTLRYHGKREQSNRDH